MADFLGFMGLYNKIASLKASNKFVLNIGDEGAVLSYFVEDKLEKRLFGRVNNPDELQNLKLLLNSDRNASLALLIDTIDQSYTHQSLPAVNALSIKGLVKKRLEKDFANNDLKGSIFLDRSTGARANWNYVFLSCPFNSPLVEWLDFAMDIENPFDAIYMLPLEATQLMHTLRIQQQDKASSGKLSFKKSKQKNVKSHWQLMITHHKIGGFRQIATKDGKIMFTRLIADNNEALPTYLAGNIEQEALNTIEYLKRLSYQNGDILEIVIVASQDIKNHLLKSEIKATNYTVLTPFELATKLDLKNSALEEDKYADILLASFFQRQKKHVMPLYMNSIKHIKILELLHKWLLEPLYLIVPTLMVLLFMNITDIITIQQTISKDNDIKDGIEKKLKLSQDKASELGDIDKISNVVHLYKLLSGYNPSPLSILSEFYNIKSSNAQVKSISWHVNTDDTEINSKFAANLITELPLTVVFQIDFYNPSDGYQELFNSFDDFVKKIQHKLSGYDVEYSRISENISFSDTSSKVIPVQVTLTKPKKKMS